MTLISNQALKENLALGDKKKNRNLDFVKDIHSKVEKKFKKLAEKGKYFTIDYALNKAEQYKEKYKIDIQAFEYTPNHIDYGLKEEINECLNAQNPVGFYTYYAENKRHVDGFIVHDNKILVMHNSSRGHLILKILKENFGADKIYVQHKILQEKSPEGYSYSVKYDYPQKDNISCTVFALKYLKECLKDNAKLLSMTQFIPSSNDNTTDNQFVLHPAIERYSQSDNYYRQVKEYWKTHNSSEESNEILNQADKWRVKHDKTRMMYYLLKDLSEDNGYKALDKVKQNIIKGKDLDNDSKSDDEAIYFP